MSADRLLPPFSFNRRVVLLFGAGLLLCLVLALAKSIATGDLSKSALLAALVCSPTLVWLAINRPYVFPYGLYVLITPFDGLLQFHGTGTITKFLGIAALVALLFSCITKRNFVRPPLALWFVLAYLAWNVASLLWAANVSDATVDGQTLASLVAMYALLSVSPLTERDLRMICGCIVAGGVALSVFGMYLLHNSAAAVGDAGRLTINIDNTRTIDPNHFANSLLAPLALALVALAHARTPLRIALSLGAVALLGTGILISLSREALLGVVLIVVVLALFSRRRLLSASLLIPPLVIVPLVVPSIGQRMALAFSTGGAGRTSIWQVGWYSFLQRPVIGWGVGGALQSYDTNFLSVFQKYDTGWGMPPHNTYLHILIELGVVGFMLGSAAFVSILPQLRGIERGDSLFDLRVALTASLVAIVMVAGFIDLATYKYAWLVLTAIVQLSVVVKLRAANADPSAQRFARG